jgi:hypothetical protein
MWVIDFPGKKILEKDRAIPYHLYPPTVAFEYAFPVRTTSSWIRAAFL